MSSQKRLTALVFGFSSLWFARRTGQYEIKEVTQGNYSMGIYIFEIHIKLVNH